MESAFHAYYRNVRFYDCAPSRLADKEPERERERERGEVPPSLGILISVAAAKDSGNKLDAC